MLNLLVQKIRHISLKTKFTDVYRNNSFGGAHSRSGEGSGLLQTGVIREQIPRLLERIGAASMVDAPCGDLFWLGGVRLPLERYLGVDIVSELIRANQERFGNEQRSFQVANLVRDVVPKADVILCRDCLVHLCFKDALKILTNFQRSGSTYLLTTTFTGRTENADLGSSFWRPLNLRLPPFNFPEPLDTIREQCTEVDELFSDKHLGLWRLADLFPRERS